MKRIALIFIMLVAVVTVATAQQPERPIDLTSRFIISENILGSNKIKLDSLSDRNPHLNEKVIVKGDTVSMILPEKNYGRYDRGLFNYLIIPRGQWSAGLTASYGEFGTDDIQVLDILQNFDINVKAYSIKPYISYFFRNNQSIGVKFNYSNASVDLDNLTFDFDEDMNFSLTDVSYSAHNLSASINYRNYIGLGPDKRFAIFNEVDLGVGGGSSRFKRTIGGEVRDTHTNVLNANLTFSPGLCVFIMDYVSVNVSFGVFGLNLRHEEQTTNGVDEGSRFSSGANFKFNIFNINFGMAVHI